MESFEEYKFEDDGVFEYDYDSDDAESKYNQEAEMGSVQE